MDRIAVTERGLAKLKEELSELQNERRPQVAADVARFREMGDLKENAEYHAAREELAMIDAKIRQIETKVAIADIIPDDKVTTDQVVLGTRVTIEETGSGDVETWDLVGEGEVDLKRHRILTVSPLGQALLTKKVGDVTVMQGPRRSFEYKILKIELAE